MQNNLQRGQLSLLATELQWAAALFRGSTVEGPCYASAAKVPYIVSRVLTINAKAKVDLYHDM